jgi:hypothetical protein
MPAEEVIAYAAPATFSRWDGKGRNVPPNILFGCNLVRR